MMKQAMTPETLAIEGYVLLSGVEDLTGDVVRAFARTLARGVGVGMLLKHAGGRAAGRWTNMREDGRVSFVRGLVTGETAAGQAALKLIGDGTMSGLSNSFIARD